MGFDDSWMRPAATRSSMRNTCGTVDCPLRIADAGNVCAAELGSPLTPCNELAPTLPDIKDKSIDQLMITNAVAGRTCNRAGVPLGAPVYTMISQSRTTGCIRASAIQLAGARCATKRDHLSKI